MVNPASVVTITMRKAENASGGTYCSGLEALLLLPATDGGNCAETLTHSLTHDKYRVLHAFIQSSLRCSECIHFQYEWSKGDSVILLKN